jgi:hypothetical protein
MHLFRHWEPIKGTSAKTLLEGGGTKNRTVFFFLGFTPFQFTEFCRMCYFEFLNSILIKKFLKWTLVFFRIFYFNFLKIPKVTDQFLVNRSSLVLPVFVKMDRFLTDISIHGWMSSFLPLSSSYHWSWICTTNAVLNFDSSQGVRSAEPHESCSRLRVLPTAYTTS